MSAPPKLACNCKQSICLIEKKTNVRLSVREFTGLYLHLFSCSLCRLYNRKNNAISKMVEQLLDNALNPFANTAADIKKNWQRKKK